MKAFSFKDACTPRVPFEKRVTRRGTAFTHRHPLLGAMPPVKKPTETQRLQSYLPLADKSYL